MPYAYTRRLPSTPDSRSVDNVSRHMMCYAVLTPESVDTPVAYFYQEKLAKEFATTVEGSITPFKVTTKQWYHFMASGRITWATKGVLE